MLSLKTAYYSATIPIWLDETTDPATWATDFLTPDAGEVIRAVGAWIVVFRNRSLLDSQPDDASQHVQKTWSRKHISATLTSIKGIIAHAHNDDFAAWDGTCLAIGMPGGAVSSLDMTGVMDEMDLKEQWEDECFEAGFEYVDCTKEENTARNEVSELTGLARVREALEAVEWEDLDQDVKGEAEDVMFGGEREGVDGDEDAGFRMERHELEREFVGLKMDIAVAGEGDEMEEGVADEEQDVEQLDVMLRKMLAVKEMSGHLTEVERHRMARKVVGEVMGDKALQL